MIPDLELSPLSSCPPADPASAPIAAMTFPAYRHLLDLEAAPRHPELGETRAVRVFGVVARHGGAPVGLALAEEPADAAPADAELLSVFVAAPARRQGVAAALVAAIEGAARTRGHRRLVATYTTARPAIGWMERVFAAREWAPPVPASLLVRFDPRATLRGRAFDPGLIAGFSRELEIFPWREIAPAEIEEIRRSDAEACWIEPSLAPWQYDPAELDPSSVGARCRGKVVGWVLNHRVARDTVRWSISYMHPSLARRGKIFALYRACVQHLIEEGSCRVCTFTTPYTYPPMVAAAKRWIGEITSEVWESRRAELTLDRDAASRDRVEPTGMLAVSP